MFTKSAAFYDAIYRAAGKDYTAEASRVRELATQHGHSGGNNLLDVGCGTGGHLAALREGFEVAGLDLDPGLLALAQRRLPDVPLHQGDMITFDLGRQFDVVTCLFSSIAYVQTIERLSIAVANLRRHSRPGGVVIVEPWFEPGAFQAGFLHAVYVDEPDLKVARMNVSNVVNGILSVLNFHYLVGTPEGVTHFTEKHLLGLFTDAQYRAAFAEAGMQVVHDAAGLDGRGLYLGLVPQG